MAFKHNRAPNAVVYSPRGVHSVEIIALANEMVSALEGFFFIKLDSTVTSLTEKWEYKPER